MKTEPGASSGLGWRKTKSKRSISISPVPRLAPPSHSFYNAVVIKEAVGLSLDLVQQENDLSSGKTFVMLVLNHLIRFVLFWGRKAVKGSVPCTGERQSL